MARMGAAPSSLADDSIAEKNVRANLQVFRRREWALLQRASLLAPCRRLCARSAQLKQERLREALRSAHPRRSVQLMQLICQHGLQDSLSFGHRLGA